MELVPPFTVKQSRGVQTDGALKRDIFCSGTVPRSDLGDQVGAGASLRRARPDAAPDAASPGQPQVPTDAVRLW